MKLHDKWYIISTQRSYNMGEKDLQKLFEGRRPSSDAKTFVVSADSAGKVVINDSANRNSQSSYSELRIKKVSLK